MQPHSQQPAETSNPPRQSLLDAPPEIILQILDSLTSKDFFALRRVSKAFNEYFSEEHLCLYAHRLYFGRTSEITRDYIKPYPSYPSLPFADGGNVRTRADFDEAYRRTRNWKLGQPTEVQIIDEVADGSVSCHGSILVSAADGLLIYQKSRGVIVIRDLNQPLHPDVKHETVIDLEEELGDCIVQRLFSLVMRDGESVRLRINRGMLLVVGEAHEHSALRNFDDEAERFGHSKSSWSMLMHWVLGTVPPPPVQGPIVYQQPHSLCAVYSLNPPDRGRLLQKWYENDSFMSTAALNEHYCIGEFHLLEQRLEGVIFRPYMPGAVTTDSAPAHSFTVRKKSIYPSLSTFTIGPDTKGKVFYLGFLPPPDRRPVVEVIAVPTKNPDGTWTECTCIKRVVLRTMAKHIESVGAALLRSYWIDFDDGFNVNKYTRGKKFHNWQDGEDVIRLRMTGDFAIENVTKPDEMVTMISWDITSRASPHQPSTMHQWRSRKEWKCHEALPSGVSPWANKSGVVDLEECYPTPTYYTSCNKRQDILRRIPDLPEHIDLDRFEIWNNPNQTWCKDENGANKYICGVFYAEKDLDLEKPAKISYGGNNEEPVKDPEIWENALWPDVPGVDDRGFCPPGRHFYASYKVSLEIGRQVVNRRLRDQAMAQRKETPPPPKTPPLTSTTPTTTSASPRRHIPGSYPHSRNNSEKVPLESCNRLPKMAEHLLMPAPGNDTNALRGVFDWTDKKYLVYGKVGVHPNRQKEVGESDRIVVVRFD